MRTLRRRTRYRRTLRRQRRMAEARTVRAVPLRELWERASSLHRLRLLKPTAVVEVDVVVVEVAVDAEGEAKEAKRPRPSQ